MSRDNEDMFQQMLRQMRATFLADVPDRLDRLDQLQFSMEEAGAAPESFNEFYRIIHSLKGSGGTFGLPVITTICHQLEDLLNTTDGGKNFSKARLAISLEYIELLRQTIALIQAGRDSFPEIEEQFGELRNRLASKQYQALIVDDSRLLTEMYRQALAEFPVCSVVVKDGYVALMRAMTEPFDLLITTNEVSGLRGRALVAAIRLSESKGRNLKTILVTSNTAIAQQRNRDTDADHILIRDGALASNLAASVQLALSSLALK